MQIVYRSTLVLLALVVWFLTTLHIHSDVSYFLKTGLYNSAPLFYPPWWPALLAAIIGSASVTFSATCKHMWLRSLAAIVATGLIGAIATLVAIYCWIYADLIAAKLWGAPLNRMIAVASAFEVAILAIMYLIATMLLSLRHGPSRFDAVIATFGSTGLAKAILLAMAPRVPVPGLSQLTCNGPCL